jgi:DMSO/TMAO reductase YedYZ molybdopterin-dependent catalytic subunit
VAGRRTNVALLWLSVASLATGLFAFAVGSGWNLWVTLAHGAVGFAVLVLAPWKSSIVRRGWRRRRPGRVGALVLTLLVAIAVVSGVMHSLGALVRAGPVSTMQLHVAVAVAAIALLLWHAHRRPARLRTADAGRREVLRGTTLLVAGAAVTGATRIGSSRRFTGSHERGSFDPASMPVTQWFNDSVPRLDGARWRLRVGERDLTYEELAAFDDDITAELDCTGGWYARQRWAGALLDRLLREAPGESLVVVSATGYSRRFPRRDAPRLLLATRVGGEPLSAGHGYPARLVAPGRRGFWWVKWVTEVQVDDRPWWLQTPFPLT